jgi:hypothetical protein
VRADLLGSRGRLSLGGWAGVARSKRSRTGKRGPGKNPGGVLREGATKVTHQLRDSLRIDSSTFDIVAVSRGALIELDATADDQLTGYDSDNWRGYLVSYAVTNGLLIVENIQSDHRFLSHSKNRIMSHFSGALLIGKGGLSNTELD